MLVVCLKQLSFSCLWKASCCTIKRDLKLDCKLYRQGGRILRCVSLQLISVRRPLPVPGTLLGKKHHSCSKNRWAQTVAEAAVGWTSGVFLSSFHLHFFFSFFLHYYLFVCFLAISMLWLNCKSTIYKGLFLSVTFKLVPTIWSYSSRTHTSLHNVCIPIKA